MVDRLMHYAYNINVTFMDEGGVLNGSSKKENL